MFGKKVACASCGQTFLVPAPTPVPAVQPAPRAATPPAPTAPGLDDLLSEALGASLPVDPLTGPALAAGTPLAGGVSSYRRRRMSGADAACLLLGSVLAVLDVGCLLVLFPILGVTATAAMVAAIVLGVVGAGLIVFAQRRNLLVALPVGTGICCLLFIGIVIRPLPKTPEQLAEECLLASQEFVAALESIHDETTLRQARPKVLNALTKMFQIAERVGWLESEGRKVSPETEQKMKTAMNDFGPRSKAAGQRLRDIPGGQELALDMMRIIVDAQKRFAAIPKPSAATAQQRKAEPPSNLGTPAAPPSALDVPTAPGDIGRLSELIGGSGGSAFLKTEGGRPMVGLAWTSGSWAGEQAIGQLTPIFDRNAPPSLPMFGQAAPAQSVVAKEGYAIGGLVVAADHYVYAIQPIFMNSRPFGKLDPADRYEGKWLGDPAGKDPKTIDGKGDKVIGIHGRGAAVLDAVGLVFQ